MTTVNLTLISKTPSENGGEILKLQNADEKAEQTAFGMKTQKTQVTYYMKVDKCPLAKGKSADLDLDMFNIVERPFEIEDEETKEMKTIHLKWLHLK